MIKNNGKEIKSIVFDEAIGDESDSGMKRDRLKIKTCDGKELIAESGKYCDSELDVILKDLNE